MNKIVSLIIFTVLISGCGTSRMTAYPDNWPAMTGSSNISGTYKNGTASSSHTDQFGTLFSRLSWIHFFGYSDRNEIPVSQGMKKEVDNKENSVRIVQEVDAISASLYSGAAKVKELLFRFYGKEKNCVLMTARVTVHGEIMYGYTFYFSKARDGSLVLEEKRSMTHGWFLESTDRENSWHRWERAGE